MTKMTKPRHRGKTSEWMASARWLLLCQVKTTWMNQNRWTDTEFKTKGKLSSLAHRQEKSSSCNQWNDRSWTGTRYKKCWPTQMFDYCEKHLLRQGQMFGGFAFTGFNVQPFKTQAVFKKKEAISWTKTSKRTVVSFNEFSSPSSHFKPKRSKWHVFLKHLETQSIPLREHMKLPLMFLSSAVAAQWVSTYCVCIHKSVFWLRTCAVAAPVLRVISMGAVRGSFSRPSILSPPPPPVLTWRSVLSISDMNEARQTDIRGTFRTDRKHHRAVWTLSARSHSLSFTHSLPLSLISFKPPQKDS